MPLTTGNVPAFLLLSFNSQSAALGLSSAVESALGVVPCMSGRPPIFEALPEVSKNQQAAGDLMRCDRGQSCQFLDIIPMLRWFCMIFRFAIRPGQVVAIVGPSGSGQIQLTSAASRFRKTGSWLDLLRWTGSSPIWDIQPSRP